jgi:excisionase family DNA binding protein
MSPTTLLTIGELARRTGLSVSAIRFYEQRGLVTAVRTGGNQRRFPRADIRKLSFALIAQQLGLTLSEISAELATLPRRGPTGSSSAGVSGERSSSASRCSSGRATCSKAASAAAACRSIAVPCSIPATASQKPVPGRASCSATGCPNLNQTSLNRRRRPPSRGCRT